MAEGGGRHHCGVLCRAGGSERVAQFAPCWNGLNAVPNPKSQEVVQRVVRSCDYYQSIDPLPSVHEPDVQVDTD